MEGLRYAGKGEIMMRRKVGKLLGDRRVVGGFLLLIQLAIVMFGVSWASTEYHWLTPALTVLSVIIVDLAGA